MQLWLLLVFAGVCVRAYPADMFENLVKEYSNEIEKLHKEVKEIQYEKLNGKESSSKSDVSSRTEHNKNATAPHKEFDFIVIGGGSSGSALASRLSEIPEWRVLLIESGKHESRVSQIPAMAEALQHSEYNWGYHTEPQSHACLGLVDHKCPVPAGKALGGTSVINNMLYTRGNRLDYDRWADEDMQKWCYDQVLPYFRKSEDTMIEHFDNKYHRHGGPMHIENPPKTASPAVDAFLEACHGNGLPDIDYNGKQQLGAGVSQTMSVHGRRQSTASSFLRQAAPHRPNLYVATECTATKVVIGEHALAARAVHYVCADGSEHESHAKKEVVLAAGAIHSPHLLMASGVGPKEQLEQAGVPVRKDLPGVGANLQMHPVYIGLNFILKNESSAPKHDEALRAWIKDGTGPLAVPGRIAALAYTKTDVSKDPHKEYPDVELQFVSRPHVTETDLDVIKRSASLTDEMHEALWKPLLSHNTWSMHVALLHPKSTGHVALDKTGHLTIHGNQLTDKDDHDLQTMVAGIRAALKIAQAESFKKWGSKPVEVPVPGCGQHEYNSDAYWKCAVLHLTTVRNPYGTCKMGTDKDKMAVVDEELRVRGVHGLRVADNSVVPFALSAHATAPAVMIAEKAADMIKETWK